MIYSK